MDAKPDPKPGRWILPLIIVAMVGFTYVFVSSIDDDVATGDDGDGGGVDIGASTSTTMPVIDTTEPDGGDGGADLDPDTQAYVDRIQGFDTELGTIVDDFVAANEAWDNDTATYSDSVDAFAAQISALEAWSSSVAASTAPASRPDLTDPHQVVKDAAAAPLEDGRSALEWLESDETGSADNRRQSITDLQEAAQTFSDAVTAAVSVAEGG